MTNGHKDFLAASFFIIAAIALTLIFESELWAFIEFILDKGV